MIEPCRRLSRLAAALALLSGAGCIQAPPLLALPEKPCDSRPVLANALPVLPNQPPVVAEFGTASACLRRPGEPSATPYASFALPQPSRQAMVTVRSRGGLTLVPPILGFLAADGTVLHVLPSTAFTVSGTDLRAEVTLVGRERFLVVEADRNRVGRFIQVVASAVPAESSYQLAAGGPIFLVLPTTMRAGPTTRTITLALNGSVEVSLHLLPDDEAPDAGVATPGWRPTQRRAQPGD